MTALMATPLAWIEDYSGKGMGLGGAMSGRFDGKPSTIGNTSKYTPSHDCREGSLKMLRDLESRAAVSCSVATRRNPNLRSIVLFAQSDAIPASLPFPDR
jgi:hypothetical protein